MTLALSKSCFTTTLWLIIYTKVQYFQIVSCSYSVTGPLYQRTSLLVDILHYPEVTSQQDCDWWSIQYFQIGSRSCYVTGLLYHSTLFPVNWSNSETVSHWLCSTDYAPVNQWRPKDASCLHDRHLGSPYVGSHLGCRKKNLLHCHIELSLPNFIGNGLGLISSYNKYEYNQYMTTNKSSGITYVIHLKNICTLKMFKYKK